MTRIDAPLEITSLRDDPSDAPRSTRLALPARLGAIVAAAGAIVAAFDAADTRLGPGRFVLLAVSLAWCVGAFVTSFERPEEPLAALMTLIGGAIALAMLGSAELANHPYYDLVALARAVGIAALPPLGLHLLLGLPDGRLDSRVRRAWVVATDVAAIGLATWLFVERPAVPLAGIVALSVATLVVGIIGYVGRCQRARTQAARARLQWPAWGVLSCRGHHGHRRRTQHCSCIGHTRCSRWR